MRLCACGCGQEKTSPKGRFLRRHWSPYAGTPEFLIDRNGCWIWQHNISTTTGYGRTWNGEGHDMAHRVYYERHVGAIPEDHELHHVCGEKRCVNPRHLQPVTRREHMAEDGRRAFGNPKAAVNAA